MDEYYVFSTRSLWLELCIPNSLVKKCFIENFGRSNKTLDKPDAKILLISIVDNLQQKFVDRFAKQSTHASLTELYKVLDECYHFYKRQKEARVEMKKINVAGSDIGDAFEVNRNICRNIIDATNLWLENCVLLQSDLSEDAKSTSFELDKELLVDLYIYGLTSQCLSLLALTKQVKGSDVFSGLEVSPTKDVPIEVQKYHPVIYFNTLITGNQNVLSDDMALGNANKSDFGIGFNNVHGVKFLHFLAVLRSIQQVKLCEGKYALRVTTKLEFLEIVASTTKEPVDANKFFDSFVLQQSNLIGSKQKTDPIIWKMNVNKYRHELRPFVSLNNDRVYLSYCALDQAVNAWTSFFLNGGMCYSFASDALTNAMDSTNDELSKKLVDILREELSKRYKANPFDEINVDYKRIFGAKDINYGDFDIVYYAPEVNELFLIEAKFFSDSLTNSSIVTDYEKLFQSDGYYDRCRRRYDLVIKEPDRIKSFLGVTAQIKVHFLFVSSKPLDIELQDDDEIVTFLCADNFGKFIDGRFEHEIDGSLVRPIYTL